MSQLVDRAARITKRLADVQARASLADTFDPKALVDLDDEPELARHVLRMLARECDVVVGEHEVRWRLLPDNRRRILRGLANDNALVALAQTLTAEPDDWLGHYLLRLGTNRTVSLKSLTAAQLSQLYTAQQFLAALPPRQPTQAQVRTRLAIREFEASLRVVLPTCLFGREEELGKLNDYVSAPNSSSKEDKGEPTPVYLIGMGGRGKSALLAAFAQRLIQKATPVIWFDFDRAAFDLASHDWLTLEFSRQLGMFLPELTEPLARFREQVQASNSQPFSKEYAGHAHSMSDVWSIWQQEMHSHLPIRQPVAIVLDTFEEVILRGPSEHESLRRWLESAHAEGKLFGLRPILSGRVLPNDCQTLGGRPMELTDLNPEPAYAMLHRLLQDARVKVRKSLCRRLLAEWGASPLFIRLLARYLSEENGALEAAKLLNDAKYKGVPHTLVQGFTYQRILNRLRTKDQDLRQLAQMGLILRRVTVRLIEQVIAPPCGISTLDAKRAKDLFETLAGEVWLVEKADQTGAIKHRSDLRLVMLGLMEPDDRVRALDIHRLAEEYYRAGDDPSLSKAEQDVEADYHRLFLIEDNSVPLVLLSSPQRLVGSLGDELNRIALQPRAWLKLQMRYVLDKQELSSLPRANRVEYQSEQITQTLQRTGTFVIEPTDYGQLTDPVIPRSDLPSSIAQNFSVANLQGINDVRQAVLHHFFQVLGRGDSSKGYAVDFCETPIWRVALAALHAGEGDALCKDIQRRLADASFIEWQRPIRSGHSLGLDIATALGMLLGLLGMRSIDKLLPAAYKGRGLRRSHNNAELKALLIALQSSTDFPIEYPAPVATGLLCDLTPSFIRGLDNDLPALRMHDPRLKRLVDDVQGGGEARLADFQRTSSSIGYVELHKNSMTRPGFKRAFRPLYPELYTFIHGALRDHDKALQAFAHEASLVPVWPSELKGANFNKALMRDPERWRATLIHFADRCGLLHEMLSFIASFAPLDTAALQALTLYETYDRAVTGEESLKSSEQAGWLRY